MLRCGSHRGVFPLTKRCHSFSILQARIGDRSVLSAAAAVATGMNAETVVGNMCSVGAGCLLRSATLDAFAVVGDGCVLEEGTIMEECSELLPGSVLPAGYRVPAGEVYGGAPAEFVRELSKYEAFERRRPLVGAFLTSCVGGIARERVITSSYELRTCCRGAERHGAHLRGSLVQRLIQMGGKLACRLRSKVELRHRAATEQADGAHLRWLGRRV